MTPDDLLPLMTFGDLQAVGKRRYHALARQYHPDYWIVHEGHHSGEPRNDTLFIKIAAMWAWLRAFPQDVLLPLPTMVPEIVLELRMDSLDWPLAYDGQTVTLSDGWQVWHG